MGAIAFIPGIALSGLRMYNHIHPIKHKLIAYHSTDIREKFNSNDGIVQYWVNAWFYFFDNVFVPDLSSIFRIMNPEPVRLLYNPCG